jgi:BlaI family penicillinase repressor
MKFTKLELEVMDAIWDLRRASIREIQETLPDERRPAYTTVQTMVHRLEEKGAVRRARKIGNAFVFEATVTRKAAHRRLIDDLLDALGGSARPLMAHLIETRKLTLGDVRELESTLAALEEADEANSHPQGPRAKRGRPAGRSERSSRQ